MKARRWLLGALLVAAAGGGTYAWLELRPQGLPAGFASGNGRIQAVEIDIAAKIPGRIRDILANEGDFVTAGQVIAHMDTTQLEAQRHQAEAQRERARISVETANSVVRQREAERTSAQAVVSQREVELDAANRRYARTEQLARGNNPAASQQTLDDDRARVQGAVAALGAARAQLAASEAGISAARSQVVDAQAAIVAAEASIQAITADINDSTLVSPRDGRVQYRVAQPGEVVAAGGRVLNIVDLTDVYMTFFLPTSQAGRAAYGAEARIVLDAAPRYVIPATISFVSDVAQFTPRSVETQAEREKLMFRLRARIAPELLRRYILQVKTGLPGMAYVRLDAQAEWPAHLAANVSPNGSP